MNIGFKKYVFIVLIVFSVIGLIKIGTTTKVERFEGAYLENIDGSSRIPSKIVQNFCSMIISKDYEKAFLYFPDNIRKKLDYNEYIQNSDSFRKYIDNSNVEYNLVAIERIRKGFGMTIKYEHLIYDEQNNPIAKAYSTFKNKKLVNIHFSYDQSRYIEKFGKMR
ncbi:MAG: hypothetical protein N4A68_16135 [Maledivibacter sp.]|jgi:hypothetical protein|nr:hypothetical protein [Maledivibacter sp.]